MKKSFIVVVLFVYVSALAQDNVDDMGLYVRYSFNKDETYLNLERLFSLKQEYRCDTTKYSRFVDKETGLIGMLDRQGRVIIKPKYNGLSTVNKGVLVALKNANKRSYQTFMHRKFKNLDDQECIHILWEDGKLEVINLEEQIVIENFSYNSYLNLQSIKVDSVKSKETTRQSYKALDGTYYSFTNYKKELVTTLNRLIQDSISTEELKDICFDSVYSLETKRSWKPKSREVFVDNNYNVLRSKLEYIRNLDVDELIFETKLNPRLLKGFENSIYVDECNTLKNIYPVLKLLTKTELNGRIIVDYYDFLRTDDGFKLIRVLLN